MNPNQLFHWRKLYQDGSLSAVSAGEEVVPASELANALKQIPELQRLRARRPSKSKSFAKPWSMAGQKMDCALAIVAGGRPVKQICDVLGVARSNVAAKLARPADWRVGHTARQTDDAELVEEIRRVIAGLPSWGYRHACGAQCAASGSASARLLSMPSGSIA
ncbi:hypothetical protein HDG40_007650 [Paraburkholderia sp. JPY158]|uniref:Transposase n=1 Tax=Paraburkholderia atlantica TaxID=2654982 RepID=A0A7W8QGQ5_PARAM|nr:hypothetical protein [Paraburkholderia atlantica]